MDWQYLYNYFCHKSNSDSMQCVQPKLYVFKFSEECQTQYATGRCKAELCIHNGNKLGGKLNFKVLFSSHTLFAK